MHWQTEAISREEYERGTWKSTKNIDLCSYMQPLTTLTIACNINVVTEFNGYKKTIDKEIEPL